MTISKFILALASSVLLVAVPAVHAADAAAAGQPEANVQSGNVQSGDDLTLTARLQDAFRADKTMAGLDLRIEARSGVAYLSGKAQSDADIQRAIRLAAGVDGVKDVQSDIRLN